MILKMPWLVHHNPEIDWKNGEVSGMVHTKRQKSMRLAWKYVEYENSMQ